MPYIKSSRGGGTVLNQSLMHSKYSSMQETLKNILIPIMLKMITFCVFVKYLNAKNALFGVKITYSVPTLFLNLTMFLVLVAKKIFYLF